MPISTIGANGLTSPLPAANLGTPSSINLSNAVLDQIYHEGIDAWKATIQAVKAKYPKG